MSHVIQPPAIGILGIIGCFVAIVGTAAVSIVSAKSQNAYCFLGWAPNHPSVCWTSTFVITHITGRGVTIHRKYGSPRYEAGGSVHGPFLVISVRFGSPQKNSSKDKIKKKNSRETA